MKHNNYFILAGLFFVSFLVIQFTDIYGDPVWFKAILIISGITFLLSGISMKKKSNNESQQDKK